MNSRKLKTTKEKNKVNRDMRIQKIIEIKIKNKKETKKQSIEKTGN